MQLDQYIADLLKDHDCVIVPDFGGFVANYASAKINATNNRFDPPFRKLSYNKYLVHNDGLLASYVSQKQEMEYEAALKNVREYVIYLKDELKEKKQVSIEKVGVLYQQANGTFRFEQVKNPAFFVDGFGLESFFAKSVAPKPQPEEEVVIEEAKPAAKVVALPNLEPQPEIEEAETAQKRQRKIWPMVAAAAVLPIVGYTIWVSMSTPLFTNNSQFHYSDLNPFTEKICKTYVVRDHDAVFSDVSEPAKPVLDTKAAFDTAYIDTAAAVDKTLVVKLHEPKEAEVASNSALPYHIVGGCFGEESNAQALVSKFQKRGTNASLIDQKGDLWRVSIQSFATKKEAVVALASFRDEIPGAWVLHK
ncbi:MAG: SPOR domain-containing protein [Salibacteraceae bacterium]|nr:SPOR domain-containing protein [Salibacteraceae bacterium]